MRNYTNELLCLFLKQKDNCCFQNRKFHSTCLRRNLLSKRKKLYRDRTDYYFKFPTLLESAFKHVNKLNKVTKFKPKLSDLTLSH